MLINCFVAYAARVKKTTNVKKNPIEVPIVFLPLMVKDGAGAPKKSYLSKNSERLLFY